MRRAACSQGSDCFRQKCLEARRLAAQAQNAMMGFPRILMPFTWRVKLPVSKSTVTTSFSEKRNRLSGSTPHAQERGCCWLETKPRCTAQLRQSQLAPPKASVFHTGTHPNLPASRRHVPAISPSCMPRDNWRRLF